MINLYRFLLLIMETMLSDPWFLWYFINENPHPTIVRGFIIVFKKLRDYVKLNQLHDQLYNLVAKPIKWHDFISDTLVSFNLLPCGKVHGLRQTWREGHLLSNGYLLSQVNFVCGKKNGLYQRWHSNGQLGEQVNYIDNKKEGEYQEWSKNGQLILKTNYLNDKRDGPSLVWDVNAQVYIEKYYSNDILINEYISDHNENFHITPMVE